MGSQHATAHASPGRYLTFQLHGEEFGVPILLVREIIALHPITPLPHLPDYIKGVINLRGRILPVIDLRSRLGLPSRAFDKQTCIVIVEPGRLTDDESAPVGCIVDTVNEVMAVTEDQLEPVPAFGSGADSNITMGLARHIQRRAVVTLLHMDALLSDLQVVAQGDHGA